MELKRAIKKIPSESNLKLLSSLIISLANKVDSTSEKCINPFTPNTAYAKGSYVTHDNYIYESKIACNDADWVESHWVRLSDTIEELTVNDVKNFLSLTQEQLDTLASIISTEVRLDKCFSSSDTYTRIQDALKESKEYCLKQLASKSTGSFKKANDTTEVTDGNYLYLILNPSTSKYDIYALVDSNVELLTSVDVNLDNYYTKTEVDNDFLKKTDADGKFATITTVDGKVDKTDILTALDNAATDEQVYSAKLVNDNAIKNKSLKTYTSLEQLGLTAPVTVSEIFLAIPNNGSLAVISCDDTTTTVTDVPFGYGVLTIEKGEAGRFSILFKKSAGSSIAPNELYVGQLQGSDGSGLTWGKVMCGDKTTVVDKNSTNDTVPTSLAVRNAMLGMNVTNNTTYGDDILYFPCGIYKIVNNATAATMKNLPISSAGLLHVHSVNSHNSDLNTTTYVYRMYIFIPIGKRDVYVRNVSTGGTAGVFTVDTGWKKICTTKVEDVPVTNITTNLVSTKVALDNSDSYATYYVKSGTCYVTIWSLRLIEACSVETIFNGLPKSTIGVTCPLCNGVESFAQVFMSPNSGVVAFNANASLVNKSGYCSFSYPVAES